MSPDKVKDAAVDHPYSARVLNKKIDKVNRMLMDIIEEEGLEGKQSKMYNKLLKKRSEYEDELLQVELSDINSEDSEEKKQADLLATPSTPTISKSTPNPTSPSYVNQDVAEAMRRDQEKRELQAAKDDAVARAQERFKLLEIEAMKKAEDALEQSQEAERQRELEREQERMVKKEQEEQQLLLRKLKKVERLLIDVVADDEKGSKEYKKLTKKRKEYMGALETYEKEQQQQQQQQTKNEAHQEQDAEEETDEEEKNVVHQEQIGHIEVGGIAEEARQAALKQAGHVEVGGIAEEARQAALQQAGQVQVEIGGIAEEARQAAKAQAEAAAEQEAVQAQQRKQPPLKAGDEHEKLLRKKLKKVERLLIDLVADDDKGKDSKEYQKFIKKREEYMIALKPYEHYEHEHEDSITVDSMLATSHSTMGLSSHESQQAPPKHKEQQHSEEHESLLRRKLKKCERLLIDIVADDGKGSKEYKKLSKKRREYMTALEPYEKMVEQENDSDDVGSDESPQEEDDGVLAQEEEQRQQELKVTEERSRLDKEQQELEDAAEEETRRSELATAAEELQRRQDTEAKAQEEHANLDATQSADESSKSKKKSKSENADPKYSYEILQKKINKVEKMLREVSKEKGEDSKDHKKLQRKRDVYLLALEEFESSEDEKGDVEVSKNDEESDGDDDNFFDEVNRTGDEVADKESFEEPEWEASKEEFDEKEIASIQAEERERKQQQFIETQRKAKLAMAKAQEEKERSAADRKARKEASA